MNKYAGQTKSTFIKNEGHPNTVLHYCARKYLVP